MRRHSPCKYMYICSRWNPHRRSSPTQGNATQIFHCENLLIVNCGRAAKRWSGVCVHLYFQGEWKCLYNEIFFVGCCKKALCACATGAPQQPRWMMIWFHVLSVNQTDCAFWRWRRWKKYCDTKMVCVCWWVCDGLRCTVRRNAINGTPSASRISNQELYNGMCVRVGGWCAAKIYTYRYRSLACIAFIHKLRECAHNKRNNSEIYGIEKHISNHNARL